MEVLLLTKVFFSLYYRIVNNNDITSGYVDYWTLLQYF